VKARFEDLVQARLDPLVVTAGAGVSRDSIQWVQESLRVATMQRDAAQARADAVLNALQVYSGSTGVAPSNAPQGRSTTDVQTVTPMLDKSFIDKIVELSSANTSYRQGLTTQLVDASVDAVQYKTVVQHYQSLLDTLTRGAVTTPFSPQEVAKRLDDIIAEAKEYTKQFDALYDEYGRVAFRPAAQMYRVEEPMQAEVIQTFSLRNVALIVLAALLLAPILLAIAALVHFRLRELAREGYAARV
jgi:hypothetical protein